MDEVKEEAGSASDAEQSNANDAQTPNQSVDQKISSTKSNRGNTGVSVNVDKGNIHNLNLFNPDELASAENFLMKVMRSDKGGIKSVNDGLAVLMRAKDLNLPFSTCIEHIHVINGKTGIDIHIVKALLSRAGCTWRCIKDYQPLYEYTDGINVYIDNSFPEYVERCVSQQEAEQKAEESKSTDIVYVYPVKWYKDFNGNVYKDYQLNTAKFGIAINKAQAAEITKKQKIPVYRIPNSPVDFITEYELSRNLYGKDITTVGRFTYNEALVAGMFDKDTYKKYPRILIGHRAFTYAAREIASDILFGVMESTELKIVAGAELSSNDTASVEEAEYVEI